MNKVENLDAWVSSVVDVLVDMSFLLGIVGGTVLLVVLFGRKKR